MSSSRQDWGSPKYERDFLTGITQTKRRNDVRTASEAIVRRYPNCDRESGKQPLRPVQVGALARACDDCRLTAAAATAATTARTAATTARQKQIDSEDDRIRFFKDGGHAATGFGVYVLAVLR